ncbi:hypothetical protein HHK36_023727 [Tetracentron sinense]|uniref:Uncharacterized protein n=1 Tax=Tetracentron sinense TaxID=13715 RepID=A0A834YN67_TETSI|nr:hypothetical protein HHK36_023727 [Tetracentron sinense]
MWFRVEVLFIDMIHEGLINVKRESTQAWMNSMVKMTLLTNIATEGRPESIDREDYIVSIRRNVEELDLDFSLNLDGAPAPYILPQYLYTNASLPELRLSLLQYQASSGNFLETAQEFVSGSGLKKLIIRTRPL